jgi:DNA-binding NtrC family response regulator
MEVLETERFSTIDVKNPAAPRVLVVDDEPLIRWSLSETLADHGCEVVDTGDARGARLAVGDDQPFDVVLLDYRLPDSDDLSLLASIRQTTPTARVILMTAFSRPEVVRGALDLGAYRVINKPFDMKAIAGLVAQAHAAGGAPRGHSSEGIGDARQCRDDPAGDGTHSIEGRFTTPTLANLLLPK